jgi:hypothetical protein
MEIQVSQLQSKKKKKTNSDKVNTKPYAKRDINGEWSIIARQIRFCLLEGSHFFEPKGVSTPRKGH